MTISKNHWLDVFNNSLAMLTTYALFPWFSNQETAVGASWYLRQSDLLAMVQNTN